jgi:hypothetical protein
MLKEYVCYFLGYLIVFLFIFFHNWHLRIKNGDEEKLDGEGVIAWGCAWIVLGLGLSELIVGLVGEERFFFKP